MGYKENGDVLKSDFQSQIDKADQLKVELASKQQLVGDMVADADAQIKAAQDDAKAQYDKGFNDGLAQAGQAGGSDKLYSDQEMNDQIAKDKADADARVAALQADSDAKLAAMQSQLDQLKADLDASKAAQADAEARLAVDESKLQKVQADIA